MAYFYWSLGLKVLFFTREMDAKDELKWRLLALARNQKYTDVLKSRLSSAGIDDMENLMDEFFQSERMVFTHVSDGVSGFRAEIEDVRPQIVFHDYFKAMADDMMGDKVTGEHRYVARAMDQIVDFISTKAKIPCILCGHANREGAKSRGGSSTEHAWSDHITRRVDGAFRIVTDRATERMAIFVNAGRSLREGLGMTLDATLCEHFGEVIDTDYSWVKTFDDSETEENASQARTKSAPKGEGTPSKFSSSSFKRQFKRG